jgi:CTD small phosphatase-like protein 2
MEFLQELS